MTEVIDFKKKAKKVDEKETPKESSEQKLSLWEQIEKKNQENAERLRLERAKQNESVKRSYRIKSK